MKENIWAKTTLSVYRYLERICGAIDKLVESRALGSFYVCSGNFYSNNVLAVADKIISLSERKKTLINLKILVEKALQKCDKECAQLLIEKYIEGEKGAEIAKRHNFPKRSYFRKMASAENNFTSKMALLGYSESKLSKFLSGEKWIMEVYNRYCDSSREEALEINEIRLNKFALS